MEAPQDIPSIRGARYTMHAQIASGGMATVHLGRLVGPHGFARTVAIKELHETFATNTDFVNRFLDEARLVARIRHPNVMPTLDIISEKGNLRIVMEYVAGETLDPLQTETLARGEKCPPRIACAIMVGVLHGLHAAHEAKNEFGEPLGIVHLDVSPQNILVGTDGVPRVLDFGLARAQGQRPKREVSGKIGYMAPEQVRGAEVTPRTDVFAASIVLWELLTGESLFVADNFAATLQRVLSWPIPDLREKDPLLPSGLSAVLTKGLERDPGARFQTARDMALAIEKVLALAAPSEVATWVESTCSASLAGRAAQVQTMERESVRAVDPREMYAELAAKNLPSSDLEYADTGSLLAPPGPPNSMIPQRAADGSVRWKRMPMVPAKLPPRAEPRVRKKPWALLAGGVALLAVLALVLRSVLLPGYIKDAAIEMAAAEGVNLTIDDAKLGGDGVILSGLHARLAGVPQVTVTIASATAHVAWRTPARVTLDGVSIAIDGDARATATAVSAWFQSHHGTPPGRDATLSVAQLDVPAAQLVWTSPFASDVTRIVADGIQGSLTPTNSPRLGDEFHFLSPALAFETRVGRFGPWNFDVDQSLTGRRTRIAFDPAVVDGPNATLFQDAHAGTTFDVDIPHLPISRLGIPPAALGRASPLPQQTECKLHYSRLSGEPVVASLKAAFFAARIPELGGAMDVHVAGEATGPSGTALPLKNAAISVGPVRASLTGTLAIRDDGVGANVLWKGDPVPCASLAVFPSPVDAMKDVSHQMGSGAAPDFAALVLDAGAFAQAAGAVKLTGTFSASGTASLDSADLAGATFTTNAKNACGLALFKGK